MQNFLASVKRDDAATRRKHSARQVLVGAIGQGPSTEPLQEVL